MSKPIKGPTLEWLKMDPLPTVSHTHFSLLLSRSECLTLLPHNAHHLNFLLLFKSGLIRGFHIPLWYDIHEQNLPLEWLWISLLSARFVLLNNDGDYYYYLCSMLCLEMWGLPSVTPHPSQLWPAGPRWVSFWCFFSFLPILNWEVSGKKDWAGGLCAVVLGCCPASATGLGNISLAFLATDSGWWMPEGLLTEDIRVSTTSQE